MVPEAKPPTSKPAAPKAATATTVKAAPVPGRKPIVLIVDDEEDILQSLSAVLEEFLPEVRVVAVRSAAAAQEAMKDDRPEVVVADFRMPGMNGLEFLSEVRDSTAEVTRITAHTPPWYMAAKSVSPRT